MRHDPPSSRPPTILPQTRRNAAVVFGVVSVGATAALVRGMLGATTTAGRVAVAVVFGLVLVGALAAWAAITRNPLQLEVWDDRIELTSTRRPGIHAPLSRDGGPVALVPRGGRNRSWVIVQPATDRTLPLDLQDVLAVGRALTERGWTAAR